MAEPDPLNVNYYSFRSRKFNGLYAIPNRSPKDLAEAMQEFWDMCGQAIGRKYKVDKFPLKENYIAEKWNEGRIAIFIPPEVSLTDINAMFSNLNCEFLIEDSPLTQVVNNSGWLWVESSDLSPYSGMSIVDLDNLFRESGRAGQSLRTYVIAGLMYKYFMETFLDIETGSGLREPRTSASILLGSWINNRPIMAYWNQYDNPLTVEPAYPEPDPDVGGSSEEVID